jgi:hypothetical protein
LGFELGSSLSVPSLLHLTCSNSTWTYVISCHTSTSNSGLVTLLIQFNMKKSSCKQREHCEENCHKITSCKAVYAVENHALVPGTLNQRKTDLQILLVTTLFQLIQSVSFYQLNVLPIQQHQFPVNRKKTRSVSIERVIRKRQID